MSCEHAQSNLILYLHHESFQSSSLSFHIECNKEKKNSWSTTYISVVCTFVFIGLPCIWRGVPIVWKPLQGMNNHFGSFASSAQSSKWAKCKHSIQSSSTPYFVSLSTSFWKCRQLSATSLFSHIPCPLPNSDPSHNTVTFPTNEYHPFQNVSPLSLDITIYKIGTKGKFCAQVENCALSRGVSCHRELVYIQLCILEITDINIKYSLSVDMQVLSH